VSETEIPSEVRQFLAENIRSIEQLEVLLLLSASAERKWTSAEVYHSVLTNERSISQTLEMLSERGLIARTTDDAYQLSILPDQTKALVTRLAQLYKERPARIIHALYAASESEVDAFAQAFKIRKDTK
jgi:hypothetical protein